MKAGENTAFFLVPGGDYEARPEAIPGARAFQAPPEFVPEPAPSLANRVFLDGRLVAAPPSRAAGGCRLLPARALLKRLGIEAVEAKGTLRVKAGARTALFTAGAEEVELNGLRFRMPAAAVREQGEWFLPDSVLAALIGRDLARDEGAGCVELTPTRIPRQEEVLWIEASKESDLQALRAMLAEIPGRQEYWAAEGKDVRFDVVLARPVKLKGVGIQWHLGATRRSKFALETSLDGATWKKVYDGASSGKNAGLETYPFDPHEARYVRFLGFGNTKNEWNSLVHFRLLPAD